MSAFRDAIAHTLMEQWPGTIYRLDAARVTADAILAMPDMEAIRAHLRLDAEQTAEDDWKRDPADVLTDWGFSPAVIEWVAP